MFRIRQVPFFDADGDGKGGNAGGDDSGKDGNADDKPKGGADSGGQEDAKGGEVTFTTEQQTAINKLIGDARKEGRDAAKRDADETKRKEDETRQRDEEVKRGDFEKVRTDLETKLTDATTERDALATKVQTYEDRDRAAIEAWVKDHKGQHPDLFEFDPGPDAPLTDRTTWFEKARKHAENRVTNPVNGTGAKPKVLDGKDPKADEEARNAQARQTANSF